VSFVTGWRALFSAPDDSPIAPQPQRSLRYVLRNRISAKIATQDPVPKTSPIKVPFATFKRLAGSSPSEGEELQAAGSPSNSLSSGGAGIGRLWGLVPTGYIRSLLSNRRRESLLARSEHAKCQSVRKSAAHRSTRFTFFVEVMKNTGQSAVWRDAQGKCCTFRGKTCIFGGRESGS